MCLDDVIAVEIGHLSSTFDPNFVLAILGQIVETSDIKPEFTSFSELADEETCGKDLVFGDVGGHAGNDGTDVEYSILD